MKLVIFDADGTLVDSLALIHGAMALTFEQFGHDPIKSNHTRTIIGLTLDHAIAKLLNREIDDNIKAMTAEYKNHYLKLQSRDDMQSVLYDGILQVVQTLSANDNIHLAIATGKSRRGVNSLLDAHNFRPHIIASRCADDCPSKPHPAMITEICDEVGVDVSDTVMIGDTSYDIDMAISAGCKAIGVSWGYHEVETLRQSGAHKIIDEPHQLPIAIETLLQQS